MEVVHLRRELQKKSEHTFESGSLTTGYWKELETGSYIHKVCAAKKTEMLRCKEQAAWIDVHNY